MDDGIGATPCLDVDYPLMLSAMGVFMAVILNDFVE
jgi:hypothetical protein